MKRVIIVVLFFGILVSGIGAENSLLLNVAGLQSGDVMPVKYAGKSVGGNDISPAVSWKSQSAGTKSYALTCIDTNPVAGNWVHWMILNVPSNVKSIQEGTVPQHALVLNNSFGTKGYGGPTPPAGTGVHNYVFTIYALSCSDIPIKNSFLSYKAFLQAVSPYITAKATFTLKYGK